MTTAVRIASQALRLIRANTIASFNEGTNEADIADLYYQDFVEDILTRYPWSFATKRRLLNQDSTPPVNEYSYQHIVPAETLRIWAVFNSGDVGAAPINQYDIQTSTSGRRIQSNNPQLWASYTIYTAESNWPGYFTHFAQYAFAAHIALPTTDQPDVMQLMHQLAYGPPSEGEKGGKFAVAAGIDAMQKPPIQINSSPFVSARFS